MFLFKTDSLLDIVGRPANQGKSFIQFNKAR